MSAGLGYKAKIYGLERENEIQRLVIAKKPAESAASPASQGDGAVYSEMKAMVPSGETAEDHRFHIGSLGKGETADLFIEVQKDDGGVIMLDVQRDITGICTECAGNDVKPAVEIYPFVPVLDVYAGQLHDGRRQHGYTHRAKCDEFLSLCEGYVYLFKNGKLWREVFIDCFNKMSDVDVAYWRDLNDAGSGGSVAEGGFFLPNDADSCDVRDFRAPVGQKLDSLWLAHDPSVRADYRIFFSQRQLSWSRVLYYEGNKSELDKRSRELTVKLLKEHPIENMPPCLSRVPELEFLHYFPEEVGRDFGKTALNDLYEKAKEDRERYWNSASLSQVHRPLPQALYAGEEWNGGLLPKMLVAHGRAFWCSHVPGPLYGPANALVEIQHCRAKLAESKNGGMDSLEAELGELASGLEQRFTMGKADTVEHFPQEQRDSRIFVVPLCDHLYTLGFLSVQLDGWNALARMIDVNNGGFRSDLSDNDAVDGDSFLHQSALLIYMDLCVTRARHGHNKLLDRRLNQDKLRRTLQLAPRMASRLMARKISTHMAYLLKTGQFLGAYYDSFAQNGPFALEACQYWNDMVERLGGESFAHDPLFAAALRFTDGEKPTFMASVTYDVLQQYLPTWSDSNQYSGEAPLADASGMPCALNDGSGTGRFWLLHKFASDNALPNKIQAEKRLSSALLDLAATVKREAAEAKSGSGSAKAFVPVTGMAIVRTCLSSYYTLPLEQIFNAVHFVDLVNKNSIYFMVDSTEFQNLMRIGDEGEAITLYKRGGAKLINPDDYPPYMKKTGYTQHYRFADGYFLRNAPEEARPQPLEYEKGADSFRTRTGHNRRPDKEAWVFQHGPEEKSHYVVAIKKGTPAEMLYSDYEKSFSRLRDEHAVKGSSIGMRVQTAFIPLIAVNLISGLEGEGWESNLTATQASMELLVWANYTRAALQGSSKEWMRGFGNAIAEKPVIGNMLKLPPGILTALGAIVNGFAGVLLISEGSNALDKDSRVSSFLYFSAGLGLLLAGFSSVVAWAFTGYIFAKFLPGIGTVLVVASLAITIIAEFLREDDTELRRVIMHGAFGDEDTYSELDTPAKLYYHLLSAIYPVRMSIDKYSELLAYGRGDNVFAIQKELNAAASGINPDSLILSIFDPLSDKMENRYSYVFDVEESGRIYKCEHLPRNLNKHDELSTDHMKQVKEHYRKNISVKPFSKNTEAKITRYILGTYQRDEMHETYQYTSPPFGIDVTISKQVFEVALRLRRAVMDRYIPSSFPMPNLTHDENKVEGDPYWFIFDSHEKKVKNSQKRSVNK